MTTFITGGADEWEAPHLGVRYQPTLSTGERMWTGGVWAINRPRHAFMPRWAEPKLCRSAAAANKIAAHEARVRNRAIGRTFEEVN